MTPFDLVTNAARLAALEAQDVLDPPSDDGFDDVALLAAQLCGSPVAIVSLGAADRHWCHAGAGFERCRSGAGPSLGTSLLDGPDLVAVPDLRADARTATHPLVAEAPHLRFFAGTSLRDADGRVLASLCVLDDRPRPDGLTAAQSDALRGLARRVAREAQLSAAVAERDLLLRERSLAEMRRYGLLTLGDYLRDVGSVAELTFAAAAIIGQTLGVARAGFAQFDENDEDVEIARDWTAGEVASLAGRHRFSAFEEMRAEAQRGVPFLVEDVEADPRTAAHAGALRDLGVRSLANMPVRERGRTISILFVHAGAPRPWSPEAIAFLRNAVDRVGSGIARLQAETAQRLLNEELSHRMKNTFAMVQAMATQTLKAIEPKHAVESFNERLRALASAHDVLLQRSWVGARIHLVVRSALEPLGGKGRFSASGPDIDLGPSATLSLSLLLHELATNAVKYGALSSDEGRIEVSWSLADGKVTFTWRERGGPPATPPQREGFGSRLLRLGLLGSGGAVLRYGPDGFEGEFTARRDDMLHT